MLAVLVAAALVDLADFERRLLGLAQLKLHARGELGAAWGNCRQPGSDCTTQPTKVLSVAVHVLLW